jgi:hypothetical protein
MVQRSGFAEVGGGIADVSGQCGQQQTALTQRYHNQSAVIGDTTDVCTLTIAAD